MKTKAYFNWSSGKDSALALYRALNRFDIKALLTVIDSTNNRIPMHGTNLDLLKAQSQSIGIPLVTCDINTEYSEDKYKISLYKDANRLQLNGTFKKSDKFPLLYSAIFICWN